MAHEIVAVGNSIVTEKLSYKGWQKQYGKSVGLRAPGMFMDHLRRIVASTGGFLTEVSTRRTKLSQFCHGCGQTMKKPLSQRLHQCACGVGPVQRDLYAAFLGAGLAPKLWSSQSRSASVQKSKRTHTRANLPASARKVGSVEGMLRTPRA